MNKLILLIFFLSGLAQADEQPDNSTPKVSQPAAQPLDNADEKALAAVAMVMLSENKEFQKAFAKIQQQLPKTLALAKAYHNCLQGSDDKSEALDCQKTIAAKAKRMGIEDDDLDEYLADDLGDWTAEEKQVYLQELDEDVQYMEEALPCLQKAKNPAEIINCPGFAEAQ